ncbi:hypothetical protein TYRP_020445 [Tyrophagus putrescentiae]|nr:hypothetical protein TYRP_020445 [Tyrophagus putrescentiae]
MTFDSIDSKQDFKGHVTLKVGNSTYTINFVTGDRAHTREETLLPSGMMFGRLSYLLQRGGGGGSSPNKLVVSYPARDRYNSIHHSPVSSSSSSGVPGSSNSGSAIPSVRSQHQHYAALAEKYRERVQASQSGGGVVPPNWYYNRGKPVIYDP